MEQERYPRGPSRSKTLEWTRIRQRTSTVLFSFDGRGFFSSSRTRVNCSLPVAEYDFLSLIQSSRPPPT